MENNNDETEIREIAPEEIPPSIEDGEELQTFKGLGGQLRYRCPEYPKCKYNYYLKSGVLKHWIEQHSKPEQSIRSTLFDANDKPIKVKPGIVLPKSLQNLYEPER